MEEVADPSQDITGKFEYSYYYSSTYIRPDPPQLKNLNGFFLHMKDMPSEALRCSSGFAAAGYIFGTYFQ